MNMNKNTVILSSGLLVAVLTGCGHQSPFPTLEQLQDSSPIYRQTPESLAAQKQAEQRILAARVQEQQQKQQERQRQHEEKQRLAAVEEQERRAAAPWMYEQKSAEELDREEAQRVKAYQQWERDLARKMKPVGARQQKARAAKIAAMTPWQQAQYEATISVLRLKCQCPKDVAETMYWMTQK